MSHIAVLAFRFSGIPLAVYSAMMKSTYRVVADVLHLDGPLAGITSPAGHFVTFPSKALARKHQRFLAKVRDSRDFIRQPLTGNRIQILGSITIELHMKAA
jgi:hypothetical protein